MAQKAPKAVPEGMNTITAYLWFNGNCREAVSFYEKIFNAKLIGKIVPGPDGKSVMHAAIRMGDSNLMMSDVFRQQWAQGPENGTTASLFVYVDDCDYYYNKAVGAGCEVLEEMMDTFWGDRMGKIKDPFGHCWVFASYKWIFTEEEMRKNQEEWEKKLNK